MREVRSRHRLITGQRCVMKSRRSELDTWRGSPTKNSSKKRQDIVLMSTIQTSSEVTFPRRLLYNDWRFRRMAGCTSSAVELLFTCWEYRLCLQEKRTPRKSEHVLGIQATNGITFSTLQQEVHIQDFGFIWLKILRQPYRWGGSATILVLPIRGRQEALPHCPKEQRVIVCGIENFVFVVAVMRQYILTSKVS